ncbi:MAG: CDP-glycerol--glycerophosphate glycerophosphotransferase [Gammaproteobacteria bacterium]|nr:CDP-glycerol--glycerophosphate glycerophosphotransferase [Gammaproteobacteria bacterium]QOJ31853.1 MAG: CDP-glycerol--glycerophosphate glycerophosphotransferase [Gammaproteobacteria bacterium]
MAGLLREWREYRRFGRQPRSARRIVLYSESGQDWHHFQPIVAHLTGVLGESICYVSSDPADPGLHQADPRIAGFCIGKGLVRIWFFQFLQADVLLTQLLDLGNFDLKRSMHPVHYVYMFHSLISTHMADHANSFDHYDTILHAGPHQAREIRRREQLHQLPAKRLVPHGYHRIEQLLAQRREPPPVATDADIHVLLAPSWGEQTILNTCGLELADILLDAGFRLTLRPHFQTRWQTPQVIDRISARHGANPRFRLVEQMGESDSLFDSHVMITDWSGAGQDYGMGLEKPVLYIDLPPKSRNSSWQELGIEPFESLVREKLGALLPPQRLAEAPELIRRLARDPARARDNAAALRRDYMCNVGSSGRAGAEAVAAIAAEIAAAAPAAHR